MSQIFTFFSQSLMEMINISNVPVCLIRQFQALKRTEQALTMASEQLEHTQSVSKDLQAQVTCTLLLSIVIEEIICLNQLEYS